ncbi:MAG: hypothetical protein NTU87_01005 [Verrucomicrobia bacterium]|nr:hypothetical protein [Verrucomicrobiota bacterium]
MNPSPVLILTAAFGDGHNAAARGLASAIQLRGGTAVVADPFAESRPKLNDFFRRLYLTLINRYPHLWNLFYLACHHLPLIENTLFTNRPAYLQLRSLIETHRPKVIALTFPVYAHLIAWLPHDLRKTFQLITIVTDSISVHRLWSSAKADLWIVPNEPTARSLHALGIPMDKIRPIGFPVDPRFAAPTAHAGDEPPGEAPRILYSQAGPSPSAQDAIRKSQEKLNKPSVPARKMFNFWDGPQRCHPFWPSNTSSLAKQAALSRRKPSRPAHLFS